MGPSNEEGSHLLATHGLQRREALRPRRLAEQMLGTQCGGCSAVQEAVSCKPHGMGRNFIAGVHQACVYRWIDRRCRLLQSTAAGIGATRPPHSGTLGFPARQRAPTHGGRNAGPPYSPDVSPIENLWGLMSRDVDRSNPTTKEELRAAVLKAWKARTGDQKTMEGLLGGWSGRIQKLIECEGASLKY